jgi:hypothetical protein
VKVLRLLPVLFVFFGLKSYAQSIPVPNGDFEVWDNLGTFSIPDNWPTSDLLWHFNGYPTQTVSQDTKSHSGKYAVRIAPDTASGKIWPGFVISKFAFTKRPHHLAFFYLDSLAGFNDATVAVSFFKYNTITKVNDSIGGAEWTFPKTIRKVYDSTEVQITWMNNDTSNKPDTASIQFLVKSNSTSLRQGHLLIDDIVFMVHNSGISSAVAFDDMKIYPNPTSGILYIKNNPGSAAGYAEVMDMNGKEISFSPQNIKTPIQTLDISNLPAGIYILKIRNEEGVFIRRIMLAH